MMSWNVGRGVVAIGLLWFLAGCAGTKDHGSDRLKPGEVLLTSVARAADDEIELPLRVYLFPPLRLDRQGNALENYIYEEDEGGHATWLSPAPDAERAQAAISSGFRRRERVRVPFQDLMEVHSGYSILVVNSYYTEPWASESNPRREQMLFVRLTGAVYPADLDPSGRRELFNIDTFALFNAGEEWIAVLRSAFFNSVDLAGENRARTQIRSIMK